MTSKILIANMKERCCFLSHDTIRLALMRSYIADVTLISESGRLTIFEAPSALFLLHVIEECSLYPIRNAKPTVWPLPDADERIRIITKDDLVYIEHESDALNDVHERTFCLQRDHAVRLFFEALRDLIKHDRELIEKIGAKIVDNSVIRHIFDYRYI
jgi:hypothetical protein